MATIASLIVNIEAQTANLVTGVDRANAKIDSIGGVAAKAGALISGAFTATAIIGFAEHVADAASEIHDMAERLGVSAEAVQRFKFAADQTGATIDDVGRSINFMNRTLYEGNQGLVPLLERAHLTFADLQKMKPEDAFLAISEAIKQIPDPMLQAELATKLFGKAGQELLPAIKEGVKELGAQTVVMSTDTVNSLDDAKDVWEKFANSVTIYSAKLIADAVEYGNVWKRMTKDLDDLGLSAEKAAKIPPPPLLTAKGAAEIHLTDRELENVTKTLEEQRKVLDDAAEKARQHADAIGRIRDQLTGRGAIRAAIDMNEALRGGLPIQALDDEAKKQINKTMGEAIEAYKRFGEVVPPAMNQAYILTMQMPPAVRGITNVIKELGHEAEIAIPTLYDLPKPIALTARALEEMGIKTTVFKDLPDKVKAAAASIKDNLLGVLQSIPQTIASAFTGGGGIMGAIKATVTAVGSAIGGAIAGPIGAAIGSMAGLLVDPLKKLFGIGPTEYEKHMEAAAAETTKLQQALVASHGTMQQLVLDADLVGVNIKEAFNWKDPDAFKKVVDDINGKTELLNSAMQEYGFTWEDLGEKARGSKLSQLFDDLFAKTDILRTAGIDYDTILQRQAGDYSKLVEAAIRSGTEIPESMRPTLEKLADMGDLFTEVKDEQGNVTKNFIDLKDVHWSKSMTDGFKDVTDAIHDLTDALTKGVGGALDDIGRRVVHPRIEPVYGDSGAAPSDNDPGYASGTPGLGFVNFGARRATWLHGDEAVVPRHKVGDLASQIAAAMGGGGGDSEIHVYIGNEELDGRIVKVARKDAANGGTRQRATVGRSY